MPKSQVAPLKLANLLICQIHRITKFLLKRMETMRNFLRLQASLKGVVTRAVTTARLVLTRRLCLRLMYNHVRDVLNNQEGLHRRQRANHPECGNLCPNRIMSTGSGTPQQSKNLAKKSGVKPLEITSLGRAFPPK
jgi:hypothetical protein